MKMSGDLIRKKTEITGLPSYEEDLAFLAVLIRYEIEVENAVATLVRRQGGGEIVISLFGASNLFHHYLLALDLEDDEPMVPLSFQFQESQLTIIVHSHSRCRVCLEQGKWLLFLNISKHGPDSCMTA